MTKTEKIERLNGLSRMIIELKTGDQSQNTKKAIQSLQQEFDRILDTKAESDV